MTHQRIPRGRLRRQLSGLLRVAYLTYAPLASPSASWHPTREESSGSLASRHPHPEKPCGSDSSRPSAASAVGLAVFLSRFGCLEVNHHAG